MANTPRNLAQAIASLERIDEHNRRTHAAESVDATTTKPADPPPAIRLLDHEPQVEAQRQREGEAVLGLMHRAGVGTGQEWRSGGDLMGGSDDRAQTRPATRPTARSTERRDRHRQAASPRLRTGASSRLVRCSRLSVIIALGSHSGWGCFCRAVPHEEEPGDG
jgi:hypothetical protein